MTSAPGSGDRREEHQRGREGGSFTSHPHIENLQGLSLTEYRTILASQLSEIVSRRYRAVHLAAGLLLTGFAPLLLMAASVLIRIPTV